MQAPQVIDRGSLAPVCSSSWISSWIADHAPPDMDSRGIARGGHGSAEARRGAAVRTRAWFTPLMGSEDRWRDQLANAREAHPEPREADLERRETTVEAREIVVEAREIVVEARDAAHAERKDAAREIGAAADKRDAAADDRDAAAGKRENDLDRAEMLDPESEYGAHWPERRNAGLDRGHAKDDRTASHDDRIALTDGDVEHDTDRT
jgi:hypothetical protein